MDIIIGTRNESKVRTAKYIFEHYSEDIVRVDSIDTDSTVADAPWDKDTLKGARARAQQCHDKGSADYYVGLESGLTTREEVVFEESWAVVLDKEGREYLGYSSGLTVPKYILSIMDIRKTTHDQAMKIVDEEMRSTTDTIGTKNDTWSRYSGGNLLRQTSLEEALRNAAIQALTIFDANSLYSKNE